MIFKGSGRALFPSTFLPNDILYVEVAFDNLWIRISTHRKSSKNSSCLNTLLAEVFYLVASIS